MIDTGNPSLDFLIEENKLYVDKTDYLYKIIKQYSFVFCARPRRFGKTLLLSTLEAIFQGKRELFKGLAIDKSDYTWKKYPVLHIDFSDCSLESAKGISAWISYQIASTAEEYGLPLSSEKPFSINLDQFMRKVSAPEKKIVLIDEYDSLLINNLLNPEIENIQRVLASFFRCIKAHSADIRFCFITGVSEFAKLNIFSTMNNLTDLSSVNEYACMYGYTQEELEACFADYIEKGIKDTGLDRTTYLGMLKKKYNGYCFSAGSQRVYNPFSIGSFFSVGQGSTFDNYWIDTGNMQLLMDVAKMVDFNIIDDLPTPVIKNDLSNFDVMNIAKRQIGVPSLKVLLLQTGYLTIKSIDKDGYIYLDFPNIEVRTAFTERLLSSFAPPDKLDFNATALRNAFLEGDTKKAMEYIHSMFSSLSYPAGAKDRDEDYYQNLFCIALIPLELNVREEVHTNKGRIDAVLECPKHVYVFVFKVDKSAEEALCQIKEKGYAEQFQIPSGKTVHLIGINFSTQERNIVDWKEEKYPS